MASKQTFQFQLFSVSLISFQICFVPQAAIKKKHKHNNKKKQTHFFVFKATMGLLLNYSVGHFVKKCFEILKLI